MGAGLPAPGRLRHRGTEPGERRTVLERVDDGLVAVINDLHKGRHTGTAWFYFIDVTAVICLLFAITGLLLLYVHAGKRRSTWPLVGLGTAVPFVPLLGIRYHEKTDPPLPMPGEGHDGLAAGGRRGRCHRGTGDSRHADGRIPSTLYRDMD